jgi:hypothetical protein
VISRFWRGQYLHLASTTVGMSVWGVAQKLLSLAPLLCWSEQGTPIIIDTMQPDGQEQAMVLVAQVEQRPSHRSSTARRLG